MTNRKQAKRAAALKGCEILHKLGELDNNLRPVKRTELSEETEFLFQHWPEQKEKFAGNKKNIRLHKIHVSFPIVIIKIINNLLQCQFNFQSAACKRFMTITMIN